MYDLINMLMGLKGAYDEIVQFLMVATTAFYIAMFILLIGAYVLTGYMLMCIGRKAHLDKSSDWMPYFPIARQIYQMRIADCPCWYIFLFQGCFINWVITFLLFMLFGRLFGVLLLALFAAIIYYIVSLVFSFFYYRRYYERFGFNRNTAWVEIIWFFSFVSKVLQILIAFSNSIRFNGDGESEASYSRPENFAGGGFDDDSHTVALGAGSPGKKKAVVTGVTGKYAGASFDVSDGAQVIFGRSATEANIVFDQFETDVSRKHCTLQYDSYSGQFTVTDQSTNGTYLEDGSKLTANRPTAVAAGTVIYLGKNKKNSFRLG